MAPPIDDDSPKKRNRFQDEEEEDGSPPVSGWGPKALYLGLQNDIRQNRKRYAIAASAMLATGLCCFITWSAMLVAEMRRPTVEMAVKALDIGANEQARAYATSVLTHTPKDEREIRATALHVYGIATCELVDRSLLKDKKPYFRNAADSLAESRELGFMPDRATDGYYYLGKALYHSQNYRQAIDNLEIAREQRSPQRKSIPWYMANAYYLSPHPDYEKGLEALEQFQATPPFLEQEQEAATLLKTFLYLKLGRLEDAKSSFQTIPLPTAPDRILQHELAAGRIRMQEAKLFRSYADALEKTPQLSVSNTEMDRLQKQLQATPVSTPTSAPTSASGEGQTTQQWSKDFVVNAWRELASQGLREAVQHFEIIKQRDKELLDLYRQAAFLEALCFEQLDEFELAQEAYYALMRTFPGTAEAAASHFRWSYVELVVKNNRNTGLAALARFFDTLDRGESYANSWMPVADMAEVGLAEIQKLTDSRQYDKAEELLEFFRRIVPEDRLARFYSNVCFQWGEQLENLSANKPYDEKQDLIRQSREKFRLAGKWYEELAKWTFTAPEYLNHVWDAAENYERGRDFLKALAMYRLYLDHEVLLRQALARYRIGRILFEMNEIDTAIRELEYCNANYPNEQVTEPARLILARAYQEKQQWDLVVRLLTQNLDGQHAPNSDVFHDSLYELGRVYDRMFNTSATIAVFEEILTLYPDDRKTAEAHYMIAKASWNEEETLNTQISAAQLQSQAEQLRRALVETQLRALDHLKQARSNLLRQEERQGLDKAEERMLRNTFFMIGRILTALGPEYFEESLQENQNAAARYQGHPDVLQAYLQLAGVLQLLGQSEQAGQVTMQAKNLLRQFVAADAFRQETIYSESQWQDLLGTP